MGGHEAVEVANTVLEVADVAWTALECSHHLHHHHNGPHNLHNSELQKELETLKSENRRLRNQLEQNFKLLNNLSESPVLLNDFPPNLYARLVSTVDSRDFLTRLKSLNESDIKIEFPFKEAAGHLKFWKKKAVGIQFAKHFTSHLDPIEGLAVNNLRGAEHRDDEDDSVAKMKAAEEALEAKQKVTNSLSATCFFFYHVL
ncbi:hypothetical protein ES319_1Z157800v1 [Gossypium barbadense]|uniref:Uncharacterized protein n=1 Tax=Gossypium barbadense TaxID=3634 RepID=A0A5J5NHA8_GOSBA|nr:hypothetical protein ES319_1Z157800v1 [Gossypium barbadense]